MLGVQLGVSIRREKTPGDPETIDKTNGFGISPFARYYALQMGKFSIFGQGKLSLSTFSTKTESGGTTTDGPTINGIAFSVFPGISYKVNEKVDLEANINGINFRMSRYVSKKDDEGTEVKEIDTDFGFGANLNNIATTGKITVGAIIKF